MLPIIRPDISFDEVAEELRAVLDSGILTNGTNVRAFEEAVASYVGVRHAVSTTSATTALHLVVAALGIGAGDEVLVSDFTFPATGNVIVQTGARPVLVDSEAGSFGIDADAAASLVTNRTAAVVAVDPFGQPADLPRLASLASTRGLALIEDAACALGASRDRRACGSWPSAGCFSFHPRKVVTTGEGGMVTTDDDTLAESLRRLRNHGGDPAPVGMTFHENGFNYRLSELAAVLGRAQMRRIDAILADRRRTADRYHELVGGIPGVTVPREPDGERWTFQSYVIVLDEGIDRDGVVARLRQRQIETTLGTYAMHAHPAFERFGYRPGDLPQSWRLQQQTLTLPLLPNMDEVTVERVAESLASCVGDQR